MYENATKPLMFMVDALVVASTGLTISGTGLRLSLCRTAGWLSDWTTGPPFFPFNKVFPVRTVFTSGVDAKVFDVFVVSGAKVVLNAKGVFVVRAAVPVVFAVPAAVFAAPGICVVPAVFPVLVPVLTVFDCVLSLAGKLIMFSVVCGAETAMSSL